MLIEQLNMKKAECLHEAKRAFFLDELHPKGRVTIPPNSAAPGFSSLLLWWPRWAGTDAGAGCQSRRLTAALPAPALLTAFSMVKIMFKHVLN